MKKNTLTFLISLVSILNIGLLPSCKKIDPAPQKTTTDSLKVGLLAYYTFNNTGADSSGRGNDGFVYSINSTTDRFGRANSAYYFDGVSSYIRVKDNQDLRLANTDFTINTWVNLVEYNQSYVSAILVKRNSGPNNGWGLSISGYATQINNGGIVGKASYGPGNASANAYTNLIFNTNRWYMLTIVYSIKNQQLTYYVNGVLDGVTNSIPTPNTLTNADIYIGRDNPNVSSGYYIKGSLDDMRIYNRTLSVSEIQKLYALTD